MSWRGRAVWVLGGYAAALIAAFAAMRVRQSQTSGIAAQASAGMYAFGDLTLFVGVLGILALIPTAWGLYVLRPSQKFWPVLSVASLVVATSGPVAALVTGLAPVLQLRGAFWNDAGVFGFLRVAGAPLLVFGFITCAIIAPAGRPRRALLVAAGLECATSVYLLIHLLVPRVS